MSADEPRAARDSTLPFEPRIAAGAAFALVIAVVAAVAAWPIYHAGSFLLLVGVATVVGGGIAGVAWWRRWNA
ncbi:hypothetical protein ACI3KY_16390, partial [Microbacterium sp. ZW T2_14]|uniref:hypothetical protein n=1 Tax=Microbacterium sp. ZW T2_14 TaxID=3378079 RepID=UPI003853980B